VPAAPEVPYSVDPLWITIRDFPLDDTTADFTFSKRLARDHLWTEAHAERVVTEYRRFLYLMARADQTVTPSQDVDEAWHLHLSYTRSYWEGLCGAIGRPLHHDPTEGGPDEAERFATAYACTLDRYRDTFGTAAPSDVWPPSTERFDGNNRYITVAADRYWVMRRLWSRSVGNALGTVAVFGSFVGGGVAGAALTGVGFMGPVGAFAGFFAASYAVSWVSGNGTWSIVVSTGVDAGGDGCGGCGGCGG
jgi:hypothetical protein